MLAVDLCPLVRGYLIAAHRSVEIGHQVVLESLELEPLLSLDLRLGEGSGAAVVLPILDAALALLGEMATFAEAGVAGARDRRPAPHIPKLVYSFGVQNLRPNWTGTSTRPAG